MKKITIIVALFALSLTTTLLASNNESSILTEAVSNPVLSSGTVIEVTSEKVRLIEHGTGSIIDFEKPEVNNVEIGSNYAFLKIIQSTPNGEKVINILTTKLP